MSTTLVTKNDRAPQQAEVKPVVVGRGLLNEGADVMQQLRLNGINQRDKEILLINMRNRTNNGQTVVWQKLIAKVNDFAVKHKVDEETVLGQIVDHLFKRLGSASAS